MKLIELQNVGPIEKLAIPLPDAGVVVLKGRNGVGKSHALAAVDSLVSGRGRVPCRDGAARGLIEGFGAKITIGRSQRRTGEAEVVTLEGRLDISQLVQPPIKDEEAADRQRIKALIQLSGQSADPKTFATILPPDTSIGELVGPSEQTDDPVAFAGKLKRALEAEARRHERQMEDARSQVNALRQQLPGPVPQEATSEAACQQARLKAEQQLQQALVRLKELETRQQIAAQQAEQVAHAKKQLAELEAASIREPAEYEAELADLDAKIAKLQQALAALRTQREQVKKQAEDAARLRKQIEELRKVVEQVPQMVGDEELTAAQQAVEEARRKHAEAVHLVGIGKMIDQIKQLAGVAAAAEKHAEAYREAAKSTDDVLTSLVAAVTRRLRVESGRLVCDTDRGVEAFSELSPGERWRIALEIAAEQVGQGGLVTVPQEAWESLDPINRAEVACIARQVGVVILTAEADEHQEIVAEVA
jgi:DNA repair exonuclease SbcCD ATPase subunit